MTKSSVKKSAPLVNTQDDIAFVENLKRQWVETIDAIPDPFLTVSSAYVITRANRAMADIAGVEVKKLIGKTCYKMFAGRSTPCENCHMKNAPEGEVIPGYEIHNPKNDRWYEVATRRLKQVSGDDAVVQIYRDRTDAKRLQHQLAQNEKLASIGQLAGGFAHEINNPLGGILVFSQMLLREMSKDSQHYQDVIEIEGAAKRCKTIVENLLDYSRQRPMKPKSEPCDLNEIIANAVKFASLGHNAGNRCETELNLEATRHTLQSDQNRLTQVFLNLCSNAFQAMRDGGTLSVNTKNVKSGAVTFVVVEITDDGEGISPQNLAKIFEPFFTTKEPGQGTGLGLSIVHGIMQDLGGTIEVKSKKGTGTTFTIRLPLAAGPVDGGSSDAKK